MQRISHERRRREYLLSRYLMRHALAETLAKPCAEWHLHERPRRIPLVADLPAGAHMSLSHSGGHICVALASCPVGVDIEITRTDRDFQASAELFMDPRELEQLAGSGHGQAELFYRSWCAKEAWYKALDTPAQSKTRMRSINYDDIRTEAAERRLLEGFGDGFRFAAVVEAGELLVEQASYLVSSGITLEAT